MRPKCLTSIFVVLFFLYACAPQTQLSEPQTTPPDSLDTSVQFDYLDEKFLPIATINVVPDSVLENFNNVITPPILYHLDIPSLTTDEESEKAENERKVKTYFGTIKDDPIKLTSFMKDMPKGADLHHHLTGSVYAETFLDIAEDQGAVYDIEENQVMVAALHPKVNLSIKDFRTNLKYMKYYLKWLNTASMRTWSEYQSNGHDHFFNTFSKLGPQYKRDPKVMGAMIADVIKRAEIQNIRLIETIGVPIGLALKEHIKTPKNIGDYPTKSEFTLLFAHVIANRDNFVTAAKASIDQACAEATRILRAQGGTYTYDIGDRRNASYIRFLVAVNRTNDTPKEMFLELAAYCELMRDDERVVGLQIQGPEDWPLAIKDFRKHMEVFNEIVTRYKSGDAYPNISLHAGELTPHLVPLQELTFHIRESITTGHAKRLGHALSISWEDDPEGVIQLIKDKNILVEVCPTSNWSIAGLKGNDHPFTYYFKNNVPMSINTDDEAVSRSNLTVEFVRAIQWWDLTYDNIKDLIRNSIKYSFTEARGEEERNLEKAFFTFEKKWAQKLP